MEKEKIEKFFFFAIGQSFLENPQYQEEMEKIIGFFEKKCRQGDELANIKIINKKLESIESNYRAKIQAISLSTPKVAVDEVRKFDYRSRSIMQYSQCLNDHEFYLDNQCRSNLIWYLGKHLHFLEKMELYHRIKLILRFSKQKDSKTNPE